MSLPSPAPTLQALSRSLQDLRTHLHPLLQQPLENVIAQLERGSSASSSSATSLEGRLDSAKLQVSIAYVLLDLVWVNLKLTGQEPSTHPVHADLSRVRSYFGKIKSCENGGASATSASHNEAPTLPGQERRMKVDAQAAGRFIKGAIGTHTKFQVSDDEGGGGGTEGAKQDAAPSSSSSRTVKDPFDGYAAAQGEAAESPAPSPSPATKKKRKASTSVAGADAASSPKGTSSSSLKSKKSQKKLKSSGGGGGGK